MNDNQMTSRSYSAIVHHHGPVVHARSMSSSNHYDENLLGSAPAATKEQRQEGYNVDLLGQSEAHQVEKASPRSTDVEAALQPPKEHYVATNGRASHTSFFQSKKGKITIFVIAIVVIGVVVGGAVGGTVGKNKGDRKDLFSSTTTSSPSSTSTSSSSTSANTQGVASNSIPSNIPSTNGITRGASSSQTGPPSTTDNSAPVQSANGGLKR